MADILNTIIAKDDSYLPMTIGGFNYTNVILPAHKTSTETWLYQTSMSCPQTNTNTSYDQLLTSDYYTYSTPHWWVFTDNGGGGCGCHLDIWSDAPGSGSTQSWIKLNRTYYPIVFNVKDFESVSMTWKYNALTYPNNINIKVGIFNGFTGIPAESGSGAGIFFRHANLQSPVWQTWVVEDTTVNNFTASMTTVSASLATVWNMEIKQLVPKVASFYINGTPVGAMSFSMDQGQQVSSFIQFDTSLASQWNGDVYNLSVKGTATIP